MKEKMRKRKIGKLKSKERGKIIKCKKKGRERQDEKWKRDD